jgi:lysozyme
MIASSNATKLIQDSESLSLVPYTCPAGHATIGWGHLMHKGPVTDEDKKTVWTIEHANTILALDVSFYAKAVERAVRMPLNQNQFDALVDWTFNMGTGRLNEKTCTWLRKLNEGNYAAVPGELKRWNKGIINGVLTELPGLTLRRKKEAELFAKPYPETVEA